MGLRKRIIACLDIKDGRTVKGTSFVNLKDAGDPVELAVRYEKEGIDELCFLDITATIDKRKTLADLVSRIGREISIPFTVGGGIRSVEDAKILLDAGADKVAINSAALARPALIKELSDAFGKQCVVVAIDYLKDQVFTHGGSKLSNYSLTEWLRVVEKNGAGELLMTSIENDGQQKGFDVDLLQKINLQVNIPIIASGGAGAIQDFIDVFEKSDVSAALAASVFHFERIPLNDLKQEMRNQNIATR